MSEFSGELDTAPRTAEARNSEGGCPVRIYPLRRPEGHTPPIPRYSAILPQQDKVAVLFMGIQSRDAEALRQAAFAQLPGARPVITRLFMPTSLASPTHKVISITSQHCIG
jgi:hypothetical protein